MKRKYRNCDIQSNRERCLGGWTQTYYSAYSADGYEICCDHTEGPVKEGMDICKFRVDEFMDKFEGNSDKHSDYYQELYLSYMN